MTTRLINQLMHQLNEKLNYDDYYNYIIGNNNELIRKLCNGIVYLPTPQICNKLIENFIEDKSLKYILNETKSASEKFYYNLFNQILTKKVEFKNFNEEFEKDIQPAGQQIVNFLILSRLIFTDHKLHHSFPLIHKIATKFKIIIRRKFANRPELMPSFYFILASILILLFSLTSFITSGGFHASLVSFFTAALSVIVTTVLSIILFDIKTFEAIDISGQNLLALYYRSLTSQKHQKYMQLHE